MSYWGLPNGTYGVKQSIVERAFLGSINKDALFSAIDSDPALRGAAVFFIDDKNVAVCLREFKPIIRQKPISVVLSMPTKDMTDEQFKNSLLKDPYATKLIHESLSALTSCGGLAISVFGVFSALATIAATGPVGAIIIGVGMLGTAAAATQCINGVSRIVLAAGSPKTLNKVDDNKWYQAINEGLDFVSLAAVGAASYQTLKYVKLMIKAYIAAISDTLLPNNTSIGLR